MRVTGSDIKALVCNHYGITRAEIEGPTREWRVSRPRMIAYSLTRRHCKHLTLKAIADMYGGRDHSTVVDGIESIARRPELMAEFEVLSASVGRNSLEVRANIIREQMAALAEELARIEAGFEMEEAA